MEGYVRLTDGKGMRTREKGIEESNEVGDTGTKFQMVGVNEYE